MTVLLKNGERRCDASCHFARGPVCRCICGGRYHGAGVDGTIFDAIDQTQEGFLEELEDGGVFTGDLRAAVRGSALRRELEAERAVWLEKSAARRPGRALPRARRARVVPGQAGFDFEAAESGQEDEVEDEQEG